MKANTDRLTLLSSRSFALFIWGNDDRLTARLTKPPNLHLILIQPALSLGSQAALPRD
jgi:hypothetical protein